MTQNEPIIKLLTDFISIVVFWFIWTICEFGKIYFFFLPVVWQSIPFLHIVGLVLVIEFIFLVITPIIKIRIKE